MMKKTWLAALAMALLVCLLPVMALALEKVEITSVTDNGDCTATMRWNNPNGGKVTVGAMAMTDDAAGNKLMIERNVTGSSFTFSTLAPEVDYLLLVCPDLELDYAGVEPFRMSEPGKFDDFHFSVKDTNLMYFVMKGNDYSYNYAHDLSNDRIEDLLDEKDFWVRMNISVSARSKDTTLSTLVVVTSPTGYVATSASDMTIEKDWISFWRTMIYMNDAFEEMIEATGEIPTGKYQVKLYVDGRLANTSSFTIKD